MAVEAVAMREEVREEGKEEVAVAAAELAEEARAAAAKEVGEAAEVVTVTAAWVP